MEECMNLHANECVELHAKEVIDCTYLCQTCAT